MNDRMYDGLKLNMALYADVFKQVQPSLAKFTEVSQALSKSIVPILQVYNQVDFSGIYKAVDSIRPVMELYSNYEQMNSIALAAQRLTDSVYPISKQIAEMQKNMPDFSSIASAVQQIVPITQNYTEMALNLQNALKTWEFDYDEVDDEEFDDIPEELEEAIQNVCEGIATEEELNQYGDRWQDRIKKIVSTIFKYIVFTLILPALSSYTLTPVFKTVEQILLYSEQNEGTSNNRIAIDTELEIWSDDLNQDYIEISYCQDGETISGYIKKSDLDENTIKVSEGVNIDEVMFVSHCTSLMAEYWKMDESDAYEKLNEETDIIQGFVIRNYDALSKMDDKDIVAEILKEYDKRSQEKVEVSENKKKINYTVVCVNEFANKFNIASKEAFIYLYNHKGIEFIKEHYDIEHTLSLDDAVEDLTMVCRNNGGGY